MWGGLICVTCTHQGAMNCGSGKDPEPEWKTSQSRTTRQYVFNPFKWRKNPILAITCSRDFAILNNNMFFTSSKHCYAYSCVLIGCTFHLTKKNKNWLTPPLCCIFDPGLKKQKKNWLITPCWSSPGMKSGKLFSSQGLSKIFVFWRNLNIKKCILFSCLRKVGYNSSIKIILQINACQSSGLCWFLFLCISKYLIKYNGKNILFLSFWIFHTNIFCIRLGSFNFC